MGRRFSRTIFLFSVLLLISAFLTNCESKREVVLPSSVLKIAVEDTFADNEQYQLVLKLTKYLNKPFEIVVDPNLRNSIDNLVKGEYQIIARKIPVTSELRKEVAFTDNLSIDRQVLIQREENDTTVPYVDNQLNLPGKRIFVPHASPTLQRLHNLEQEIGDTLLIEETPNVKCEELIEMVATGKIDYTVCDYETASKLQQKYANLDIDTNISFAQFQSWAVNKDSVDLLNKINQFLHSYKSE